MTEVPIYYATTDGQTRRIAERISGDLRDRGFDSAALDLGSSETRSPDWAGRLDRHGDYHRFALEAAFVMPPAVSKDSAQHASY